MTSPEAGNFTDAVDVSLSGSVVSGQCHGSNLPTLTTPGRIARSPVGGHVPRSVVSVTSTVGRDVCSIAAAAVAAESP